MTAPIPKTLSGGSGQMIVLSSDSLSDNTCTPCQECSGGTPYTWYAEGHNMTQNACQQTMGDGTLIHYFACYSPQGIVESLNGQFANKQYRLIFQQGLDNYNQNQNNVIVQPCNSSWLPSYAEWIGNGLQCVFSCQYGWDRNLSKALRQAVSNIIYNGTRADLYSFLQSMQQTPTTMQAKEGGTYAKVLYPQKDPNSNYVSGSWEQLASIPMAFDSANSREYYLENTFLYVDEIPVPHGLCNNNNNAVPEQCPLGFFSPQGQDNIALECAINATQNGIYSVQFGDTLYGVTLDPNTGLLFFLGNY